MKTKLNSPLSKKDSYNEVKSLLANMTEMSVSLFYKAMIGNFDIQKLQQLTALSKEGGQKKYGRYIHQVADIAYIAKPELQNPLTIIGSAY